MLTRVPFIIQKKPGALFENSWKRSTVKVIFAVVFAEMYDASNFMASYYSQLTQVMSVKETESVTIYHLVTLTGDHITHSAL